MDHTTSVRSELASVIVPCWNQLEFTRQCIAALTRCTRSPWELIVVNNGSSDGTGDYLAGVQDASAVPVTVIANSTNLGFPAAINQGLKYARGEYLMLLNNDAVVTEGWLEQLVALTKAEPGGPTQGESRETSGQTQTHGGDRSGARRPAPNGHQSAERVGPMVARVMVPRPAHLLPAQSGPPTPTG